MNCFSTDKEIKNPKKIKTIRIELSEEEYHLVVKQAEKMKIPIRRYAKMRVLEEEPGPDMRCRQIMQLMPRFYLAADRVTDSEVRQELQEIGGCLCRFLR